MICDSRWGFKFWRLNSLLSWPFSRQGKNHWNCKWMSHLNKIKVVSTVWTLNYEQCWLCSFLYSFHIPNFDLTLWANFWITLRLIKSEHCVFTKYNTQKFITKLQSASIKLLLTPSSPFNIKYKKLNAKNLWKCIFQASF